MPKRRLKGKVVSDKMEKTVVVVIERVFAHPTYKKRVKVTKHYKAHDEVGAKVGDTVTIEETRPHSKEKRWQVVAEPRKEKTSKAKRRRKQIKR